MKCRLAAIAALIVAGSASSAFATAINVPNYSFESPPVPNSSPYASPVVTPWLQEGAPFTSGEFYNTSDVPPVVDNADGNQLGFIFAGAGNGIYQDLTDVYTVGQSYSLTVGVQGGGGGMALNTPLQFNLYYRNGLGNEVVIGSTVYKNDNSTVFPDNQVHIYHLSDVTVNLSAVQSTDAWAGQAIGIEMVGITDPAITPSGYFDLDNVRLNAVPEPASLGALGLGAAALLRRRTRQAQ